MVNATWRDAPLATSVTCRIAVWFGDEASARMRTLARPVSSVTAIALVARTSEGEPLLDTMNRKSPEIASNRTVRPGSAMPPWESVTETNASPPEQMEPVGQPAGCVDDG